LERFLGALPAGVRHAIEFRDASWYDDRVFDALQRFRVALCLHDMPESASPLRQVGPYVYVRFHGATRYGGRYSDEQLDAWGHWLSARISAGVDVFAYFNNDIGGHAPRDAVRLRERLERIRG
jgi:uncharacterized protein YecE (DUF72 family)